MKDNNVFLDVLDFSGLSVDDKKVIAQIANRVISKQAFELYYTVKESISLL